jgi:hypothetical protein
MATIRQIAANRRNARKAAGPKTSKGKVRSSKNSFKHGLSLLSRKDEKFSKRAETMAEAMVGEKPSREKYRAACLAAEAYLDVEKVREIGREILNSTFVHLSEIQKNQTDGRHHPAGSDDLGEWERFGELLLQLQRLSRYEQRTHSRWRKAAKSIGLAAL